MVTRYLEMKVLADDIRIQRSADDPLRVAVTLWLSFQEAESLVADLSEVLKREE